MARSPAYHTVTTIASEAPPTIALPSPFDALSAPSNDDLITATLGLWRLREGDHRAARIFLEFAHARQRHLLSWLALASLRLARAGRAPSPTLATAASSTGAGP